jgi:hypothetical protein
VTHRVVLALILMVLPAVSSADLPRSSAAAQRFRVMTGHPHGWKGHVVDHQIPLCAGGLDAPSNMQWQTSASSYAKDGFERALCTAMKRQGYVLVKQP